MKKAGVNLRLTHLSAAGGCRTISLKVSRKTRWTTTGKNFCMYGRIHRKVSRRFSHRSHFDVLRDDLVDPLSPCRGPHEQHTDQVGTGFIAVQRGAPDKTPDFDCPQNFSVFL